jgi:ech hydrogenase subunit A
LPVLSTFLVEPYIVDVFGVCSQGVSQANLWVAALLSAVVFVVLFGGLGSKQVKQVPVYLAGVSENNANRTFRNSLSGETMATSRNWYMEGVFGEPKITPVGVWATSIIIVVGFCAAIATLCGLL